MVRVYLAASLLSALLLLPHCGSDDPSDDPMHDASTGTSSSSSSSGSLVDDASAPSDAAAPVDAAKPDAATHDAGGTDYSVAGPFATTVTTAEVTMPNGCALSYARYAPTGGAPIATVVLAHGFLGSIDDLAEDATRFASWGVDVIVAPLCSNSIIGVDHAKNGEALSQLADQLALHAPFFGGFSAGGLAGYLAAKTNVKTAGYIGLDPVDASDLGKNASPLGVPVRAVLTEPASCNSQSNFEAALSAQTDARAVRVTGAAHYDVVSASCTGISFSCQVCAPTSAAHHDTIVELATAALRELSGADPSANGYFSAGSEPYDTLVAAGTITAP